MNITHRTTKSRDSFVSSYQKSGEMASLEGEEMHHSFDDLLDPKFNPSGEEENEEEIKENVEEEANDEEEDEEIPLKVEDVDVEEGEGFLGACIPQLYPCATNEDIVPQ